MPFADKEAKKLYMRKYCQRMREELNAKKREYRKNRRANRTEEQKLRDSLDSAKWREKVTDDQKRRYAASSKVRWNNLPKAKRDEYNSKRSERSKNATLSKKLSEKQRSRRKWRELSPEKKEEYKQKQREWIAANPEMVREKIHRRRARLIGGGGSYTAEEWNDLVNKFEHRCPSCGRSEPEIKLTVDHMIAISKGGSNSIDNIQPLCGQCNSSKATETICFVTGRVSGDRRRNTI